MKKATCAPFVMLDRAMLDCEAYRSLHVTARAALIELCRLHNGRNNGEIGASNRWLGERLGCTHQGASLVIRQLITAGFIRVTQAGGFHTKGRPARYALTCYPCDTEPATKDYLYASEI